MFGMVGTVCALAIDDSDTPRTIAAAAALVNDNAAAEPVVVVVNGVIVVFARPRRHQRTRLAALARHVG
jgi:phosphoribosylpyrophosphate synthetase